VEDQLFHRFPAPIKYHFCDMTEIWENISKLFLSETTELFKNKLG
jgi:hypothetical protein